MLTTNERASALKEIQAEARAGQLVAAPVGRPPEDRAARADWKKLLLAGGQNTKSRGQDAEL